jgi:hypothetical protein
MPFVRHFLGPRPFSSVEAASPTGAAAWLWWSGAERNDATGPGSALGELRPSVAALALAAAVAIPRAAIVSSPIRSP